MRNGQFDFDKLRNTVRTAVRFLDRVIDINFYPTPQAAASNRKWRPVGLGLMGLQDVFFEIELPFDSQEAAALSRRIQEEIYFHAMNPAVLRASEANIRASKKLVRLKACSSSIYGANARRMRSAGML